MRILLELFGWGVFLTLFMFWNLMAISLFFGCGKK